MFETEIVVGSQANIPIQINNRGLVGLPAFAPTDTFTASLYGGQDQAPLFAPTMTWFTANGTQTGYDQAQVLAAITSAQAAQLEPNGNYILEVWWTQQTACVVRAKVTALPAPGAGGQTVICYCKYKDMLEWAPWVKMTQNADTDQEGFYSQRLQARQRMDWAIINNYRGASVGLFETHSTLAFVFGGGVGWRRSIGPSPTLITYLQQNLLIVRPQITRATAYWAIAEVARAQIGINNQWASQGPYYEALAERELAGTTAEVDLNGDGIGELFIPLDSCNVLHT